MFDFGVVPVENTLGGIVGPVNELLINTELFIVGWVDARRTICSTSRYRPQGDP